ncbi:MAG: hypothetical protein ABWY29_05150 [Blastococcus sp.]
MTEEPSKRRRPRRLVAATLVAAVVAALTSLLPGTAAAVTPQVVPLVNCYYPHSDGDVTVVFGYRSTYTTTKTIARGSRNYTTPSRYGSQMPTTFKPGTNNGVATLRVEAGDLTASSAWYLDGTSLNYRSAAYTVGVCTQAQLPALANGAAIVIALLLAGAAGVLVVRRVRRAALHSAAPGLPEPIATGGDRA